jgi:hypothetical protein
MLPNYNTSPFTKQTGLGEMRKFDKSAYLVYDYPLAGNILSPSKGWPNQSKEEA